MPRFFHAAEVVGRKIVIHGGWDGAQVFNDTWIFNTDTFVWIQVNNPVRVSLIPCGQLFISQIFEQPKTTGFGPSARYGHTMTLTADGRLLLIGGMSFASDTGIPKYNDDVRQLDTDNMVCEPN